MSETMLSRNKQTASGVDHAEVRVWIERADGKHPGVVLCRSVLASTVRYRPGASRERPSWTRP